MRVINTVRQKNNVVETDTLDRIVSPDECSQEEPEERAPDSDECRAKASRMSLKIRISKKVCRSSSNREKFLTCCRYERREIGPPSLKL